MIVDVVIRAGVVVAVILASKHYGIWDSTDRTVELYNNSSEAVEPYANKARQRMGFEPPQPPPEGKWRFYGVHYYNQAVMAFFNLLNTLPAVIGQGLELVPGYVYSMYKSAQQQYEKHKEKQVEKDINDKSTGKKSTKSEKSCQRKCIDDTPLVEPIKPDRNVCKPKTDPEKEVPPKCKRFDDDFIYKSRLPPKEKCPCSKCKRRETEGWSDSKPKCPNRSIPENKTEDDCKQLRKKKICKICPKQSDETEVKDNKAESLKTCKKCLTNKEQ